MIDARPPMCPSAQPGMDDLRLLGVIESTEDGPRVAYLNQDVPVTAELLAGAAPAAPAEVFRIAARCEEKRCTHFDGSICKLANRIVQILPAVSDALPVCLIRSTCRWYGQEGREACYRCPQIVTQVSNPREDMALAAMPR
jgi:hypothetical protein